MGNLVMRSCAVALGVLGLVGCGAAEGGENAENVGAAEQALDSQTYTAPPGYPNVGVSYDQVSTLLNSYGDWDNGTSVNPRKFQSYGSGGGFPYFFGMNCDLNTWPYRDFLRGISVRGDTYGHTAKCTRSTLNFNYFAHVQNATREVKYLSRVNGSGTPINDTLGSEVSWNWDSGFVNKAECRAHYVATAIAQIETGEVDAIVCNKVDDGFLFNVASTACSALQVGNVTDNCTGNNCSGGNDWAPGFVKTSCGNNQFIKGVSKRTDGKIKALYCCNFP